MCKKVRNPVGRPIKVKERKKFLAYLNSGSTRPVFQVAKDLNIHYQSAYRWARLWKSGLTNIYDW